MFLLFASINCLPAEYPLKFSGGGGSGSSGSSGGGSSSFGGSSSSSGSSTYYYGGSGSSNSGIFTPGPLPLWGLCLIIAGCVLVFTIILWCVCTSGGKGTREPAPAYHIRNHADQSSLKRANKYLSKYPPITRGELVKLGSKEKLEMQLPIIFPDFPFLGTPPTISIREGHISILSESFCTLQSNQQLDITNQFRSFTIKILKLNPQSTLDTIAIGFATKPYPAWRLPGWEANSIAYHSDDGSLYHNNVHYGKSIGKPLVEGDELQILIEKSDALPSLCRFRWFVNGQEDHAKMREVVWEPLSIYPTVGVIGNVDYHISFQ